MAKTNPIGVRFDEELLLIVREIDNKITPQQALSMYEQAFRQQTLILTKKNKELPRILIYKLVNPITKEAFYIGRTSFDLHKRLSLHITQVNSSVKTEHFNQRKLAIISEILAADMIPEIKLIEEVIPEDEDEFKGFHERESYWIAEYIRNGHPITNRLTRKIKYSLQYEKQEAGVVVQDLTKSNVAVEPPEQATSNYAINSDGTKKEAINQRIAELRAELKNPPKNPQLGLKIWKKLRETELAKLEAEALK